MDAIGPLETPLRLVKGDQISDEPVTLRIPNRNIGIRGQDYEITNEATGKVMYKVKGSPISFHSTQLFCSADGKDKLFEIKYYNGNHPHFEAQRCDVIDISSDWMAGPLAIFAAYEKVYSNGDVTKQAQIYLMSQDKVRPGAVVGPRLILRGDMDTEASVVLRSTGQVLAVIRPAEKPAGQAVEEENERGRAGISGTSSFLVTVAPGMDIAAMAGIAASYNQLHNRSSAGSAGQSRANSRAPSRSASRNPSRRGSAAPVPVVNVPQHLA